MAVDFAAELLEITLSVSCVVVSQHHRLISALQFCQMSLKSS